jgi:hypothetical protein
VAAGAILSLSPTQANGLAVTGEGTLAIIGDIAADTDLSLIDAKIEFGETTLSSGATLILTPEQASNLSLQGEGSIKLIGNVLTDCDISEIAPSIKIETDELIVNSGASFTLSALQLESQRISGNGTINIIGDASSTNDLTGINPNIVLNLSSMILPDNGTITLNLEQVNNQVIEGLDGKSVLLNANVNMASYAAFNDLDTRNGTGSVGVAPGYKLDITPPTVDIAISQTELRQGETGIITFTFSEKPIGFDTQDIQVKALGKLDNLALKNNSAGLVYEAVFTPIQGKLIDNNSITINTNWTDEQGNSPINIETSESFLINTSLVLPEYITRDINEDGIEDAIQKNVAVMEANLDGSSGYVAISTSDTIQFADAYTVDKQEALSRYGINLDTALPNVTVATGVIGFSLVGSDVSTLADIDPSRAGTQIKVSIDFSGGGININSYYKIGSNGVYAFNSKGNGSDGATLYDLDNNGSIDRVSIIFTDNALGDDDPTVGIIRDPGFMAYTSTLGRNETGTKKANKLIGTAGDDVLSGLGGNDIIYGGDGRDSLDGGAGNDRLYGDQDNDTIYGGLGKDNIDGGKGNDYLSGGIGNDRINGSVGQDTLLGGRGSDVIVGGQDSDLLIGGSGIDFYKYTGLLNDGDLLGGSQDTIRDNGKNIILFSDNALGQLYSGGRGLADISGLHQIGNVINTNSNIAIVANSLQIDTNADGIFTASDDFSINLVGVTNVSYNGNIDAFMLS